MNRLYLLVPVLLLAVFGGVFWQYTRTAAHEAEVKAAEVAAAKQAESAKKAEAELKARADAEQRTAERLAEEAKRDAEKRARIEEENRRIAADTTTYRTQIATLTTETTSLEKQLTELRARREQLNTDAFALAKEVELARIAKRNAELEIQRLTDMVARQAANTTLAKP
jgi:chromosome segregation ATPase